MGNIGTPELFVVLIVALLVLGPTRLPDAARSIGKAVSEFRRVTGGFQNEVRDAMTQLDHEVQSTINPPDRPTTQSAPVETPTPYVFEPPPVDTNPHLFPPATPPSASDDAETGTA